MPLILTTPYARKLLSGLGIFPVGDTLSLTNAGASGHIGPTISNCDSQYQSSSLYSKLRSKEKFSVSTYGKQIIEITDSGKYKFSIRGATGGHRGDLSKIGASVNISEAVIDLLLGDILTIIVGQRGSSYGYNHAAVCSGGGATAIHHSRLGWILVAGGGGGTAFSISVADADSSTVGKDGYGSFTSAGGTEKDGGTISSRGIICSGKNFRDIPNDDNAGLPFIIPSSLFSSYPYRAFGGFGGGGTVAFGLNFYDQSSGGGGGGYYCGGYGGVLHNSITALPPTFSGGAGGTFVSPHFSGAIIQPDIPTTSSHGMASIQRVA